MKLKVYRNNTEHTRWKYATLPIKWSARRIHLFWVGPVFILFTFGRAE
jgi:hypothetical protein